MRSRNELKKIEKEIHAEARKFMCFVHYEGQDWHCNQTQESFTSKEALEAKYPEDLYEVLIINVIYDEKEVPDDQE